MKNVRITGPEMCQLEDVPNPTVKKNFCLIKIIAAPMCTEYHSYKKGELSDCLGHEAAGEVVEIGPDVTHVKKGDRVAVMPAYPCGECHYCNSGNYIYCQSPVDPLQLCESETGVATYAQYCIKQDWLLLPIPDDMSYNQAAMTCCGLGPTFGAMQNLNVSHVDTVLIVGLGPVGLGGIINAVHRDARVIAADIQGQRREMATELGASETIDPSKPDAIKQIKFLTEGLGVAKTIECTGIPAAQQFSIDATRRLGHVAFVGWGGHIEIDNMIPGGRCLQGSWHWNLNDQKQILQVVTDSASKLDKLITHSFPLSQVQDAWKLQLTGNCGKIILNPWKS